MQSTMRRLENLPDIVAQRHENWDDLTDEEQYELLDRARDNELMPALVAEGIFECRGLDAESRKIFRVSPAIREAERGARGLIDNPPETEQ
jgi:hypothetical protein